MRSELIFWSGWLRACFHILFIYMVVGGRFLRWRVRLWRQPVKRIQRIQGMHRTHERMKQTMLFVRHGQTTWNVEHRLPGQLPGVELNDTGREQARKLADALSVLPISCVISSPLERAYETAEIVIHGKNLDIQTDPDLMDTNVGPWSGQVIEELSKNDPAWKAYVRDPNVAPEGVETFPQVQQRVIAAVERWRARDDIGPYPLFVAHADVVKLIIAYYTGLETGKAGSLHIDNASVSIVEFEKEQHPHVIAIGWTPNPGWLRASTPDILKPKEETQKQEETLEQKEGEQKS